MRGWGHSPRLAADLLRSTTADDRSSAFPGSRAEKPHETRFHVLRAIHIPREARRDFQALEPPLVPRVPRGSSARPSPRPFRRGVVPPRREGMPPPNRGSRERRGQDAGSAWQGPPAAGGGKRPSSPLGSKGGQRASEPLRSWHRQGRGCEVSPANEVRRNFKRKRMVHPQARLNRRRRARCDWTS